MGSDSLVVENHVRKPNVFRGQSDLHHSIKLLRGPSQTIVLPLLRAKKKKVLSHTSTNHTVRKASLQRDLYVHPRPSLTVCQTVVNMTHQELREPEEHPVLSFIHLHHSLT